MFDYRDPGTDPDRCDALSTEPVDFDCIYCGTSADDETFWPYCCAECVTRAEAESEEDR
jgi:hypothetical protein